MTFPDKHLSLADIQRYFATLRRQLSTTSEHLQHQIQQERDRHRAWIARQLDARKCAKKR